MNRGLILTLVEWYQDTRGVRRFARAMRRRLRHTRRNGRGGWWHPHVCDKGWIRQQVVSNAEVDDYVDCGTFSMMAWVKYHGYRQGMDGRP